MSKIKLLTYLIFLTPLLMFSQKALGHYIGYNDVPDSFKERYFANEERNFFPMHVGDMWQYMYYDLTDSVMKYFNVSIISDTLINGKRYYKRIFEHLDKSLFFATNNYYTADSLLSTEYLLDTEDYDNDGIKYENLLSDSLSAPLWQEYTSYFNPYYTDIHYIREEGWYIIGEDTLLSKRLFSYISEPIYVDKFWIVEMWPEEAPPIILTGAIIDGVHYGTIVDVEDTETQPQGFALYQNYPNPFNPTTTIKYSIPANAGVETQNFASLRIYNVLGEEITTLVNKYQAPGNYTVQFNASNLSSGVYFYRLQVGNFVSTKKMILMK